MILIILLVLGAVVGTIFATLWASEKVPIFHYLYEIHPEDRVRLIHYIDGILASYNVQKIEDVVKFLRKPGSAYRDKFVVSLNYFLSNSLTHYLRNFNPTQTENEAIPGSGTPSIATGNTPVINNMSLAHYISSAKVL